MQQTSQVAKSGSDSLEKTLEVQSNDLKTKDIHILHVATEDLVGDIIVEFKGLPFSHRSFNRDVPIVDKEFFHQCFELIAGD